MRKVKVAAAFLCLFAAGMTGGVSYDGNGMSVAHADQSNQIVEITAETVTTSASIETTAIVTTVTTASTTPNRSTTETETSVTTAETTSGETEITTTAASETETAAAVTEKTQTTTKTTVTTEAVTASPVGTETQKSEPQTETEPVYHDDGDYAVEITEREYIILCNVVGHEYGAAWVPTEEKALIVECIMNRVNSPLFPDTIYDVLMQPGQFTGIEYLIEMETMSEYYVTQSVRDAVDLYLTHPEQFQHGYLFFSGDGYQSYFRTSY